MGLKISTEESDEIIRLAFSWWVEAAERLVWKCLEYKTRIPIRVKLGQQSTMLVKKASVVILGDLRSSQLTKPQIDRLRDDLELHGRRSMEAFLKMKEPWVVSLARLLKNAK